MYFQMVSAYFGFVSQALGNRFYAFLRGIRIPWHGFARHGGADSMYFYVVSAYFGMVSQGMEGDNLCIFTWYPHDLARQEKRREEKRREEKRREEKRRENERRD